LCDYQQERKQKLRRQWKIFPHLSYRKEAIMVLGTVKPPHHSKEERASNGDQKGCRLGLKPAPGEEPQLNQDEHKEAKRSRQKAISGSLSL
jgi:hypothetical protein